MEKIAKFSELVSGVSYKDMGGWILSDGATSNRAIIQTPGTRGNLAGAPVASWVGWVDVPTSNPPADAVIAYVGNQTAPNLGDHTNISVRVATGGTINCRMQNGSGVGSYDFATTRNIVSSLGGQRIRLEVRFTNSAFAPTVRINGVSEPGAQATAGTPINWLDSSLPTTNHLTGYNWPTGNVPQGCWLNAHLTDSESETWRITGRPPAWVVVGGHANFPNNTFTGAFVTGASTTGFAQAFTSQTNVPANSIIGAFIAGQRWRVRFNLTLNSGAFPVIQMSESGVAVSSNIAATSVGENDIILTITRTASNSNCVLQFTVPGAGVSSDYSVSGLQLITLGALSLPAIQPILVVDDVTTLGGNQARLLGMTPITTQMLESQIVVPSTAFTTTSVQILGGTITGGTKRRVVSVSGNSSASVNISLGMSSGGTQIVNAQAVNGDFDISTFASRIVAANSSLWVTFSGNTTASITIRLGDIV